MNCKPGDLAVVVRAEANYQHVLGMLVRVQNAANPTCYEEWSGIPGKVPTWWCQFDRPIMGWAGVRTKFVIPDFCLRPIRPHGDEEEDQRFAPTPEEVTA